MRPFHNPAVASVFQAYPPGIRRKLLEIRRLIFETAINIEGVGELEETLKCKLPKNLHQDNGCSELRPRLMSNVACLENYEASKQSVA